jgi:hypothetical protein
MTFSFCSVENDASTLPITQNDSFAMMFRPLTLLSLLVCLVGSTVAFSVLPRASYQRHSSSRLNLLEDDDWIGQPTIDKDTVVDTSTSLHKSLQDRQDELKRGIGRRFVVRTQKGFLNVHSSLENGPFATDNIVRQLEDGQVVTSVDRIGAWVRHDQGGWSISRYGGFVFLQPLEE